VQLDDVRSEIKRMRTQVGKQRGEILQLQRAGISTASAEILLRRMLDKIDSLCAQRDKAEGGTEASDGRQSAWGPELVAQPTRWFDDEPDLSPWLKALEDVRRKATREGWCYQHVQAIIVAIDQDAEAVTGNREYFLNKPHSIGGNRKTGDVP
jgi:hypothetical protein